MYEKIELERMKLETERMKVEQQSRSMDYRFRCLEISRQFACDNETALKHAKSFADFIEGKS